jgi:hypothetical protein
MLVRTRRNSAAIRLISLAIGATCVTWSDDARAIDLELSRFVPSDALAAIIVDRPADQPDRESTIAQLAIAIAQARDIGLLNGIDPKASFAIDVVAQWPWLSQHPFLIILTNIAAEPNTDRGHKLSNIEVAIMIKTPGDTQAITRSIQRILNRYTNSDRSTIESDTVDGHVRYRLVDREFPDWSPFEWGQVDSWYVIGIGRNVFARFTRTIKNNGAQSRRPSWLDRAMIDAKAQDATSAIFLNVEAIHRCLKDGLDGKNRAVAAALHLDHCTRLLHAFGYQQRAFHWTRTQRVNGSNETINIAESATRDERASIVPAEADRYAVIEWHPVSFVRSATEAYLAMRSPKNRERVRQYWTTLQADAHVSIERDILHQLGRRIIVHHAPNRPFNLDLYGTWQFEIAGSPDVMRTAIDRLFRRWQAQLDSAADDSIALRLKRAQDGVWFLQYGVYGPALGVHDRWLIVSMSPLAVRENLTRLATVKRDSETANPQP